MIGPKDSSLARYMWSSTSVNTVGSMKKPVRNNKSISHRRDHCHPQFTEVVLPPTPGLDKQEENRLLCSRGLFDCTFFTDYCGKFKGVKGEHVIN